MPNPTHLAFIMDGNRRFARAQNLPQLEGHRRGYEKIKQVVRFCLDRGITTTTFFAFSTENWNRSKQEVGYLMRLILRAFTKDLKEFEKLGVRLKVIGRRERLAPEIIRAIENAQHTTAKNKKGLVQIAFNYGGRAEIVDAINAIIRTTPNPSENHPLIPSFKRRGKQRISPPLGGGDSEGVQPYIDEADIERHLYTSGVPDPDLIIRTSGEQRLSGFLLWQSAYSELYFTQTHWPAFSETDLDEALAWYQSRERRFGS